jgi:hypothetical protein
MFLRVKWALPMMLLLSELQRCVQQLLLGCQFAHSCQTTAAVPQQSLLCIAPFAVTVKAYGNAFATG